MKTQIKILVFLLLVLSATREIIAQKATQVHKDSLETIVDEYYKLNLKIFQENSTIDDIDKTFALFTEDFTYVHPKYGGTYTREDCITVMSEIKIMERMMEKSLVLEY